MAGNVYKNLSLKDFDPNRRMAINNSKKRQMVMEKNLKAAVLIEAAKKMNRKENDEVVLKHHQEVAGLLRQGKIPTEAYTKILDKKMDQYIAVVEMLEQKKISQNGWLKDSNKTRWMNLRKL